MNRIRWPRVGITGAAGFIGQHLATSCARRGASVRGLDLIVPENGSQFEQFQVGDITSAGDVARFCDGCDLVIHTAALVKEGGRWNDFYQTNVIGSRTVAEGARATGVRRLIHLSSIMVHGLSGVGTIDELAPLRGGGNPYCRSKIDSEAELLKVHSPGTIEVTLIRCGDVYGPGSIPWTIRPVNMLKGGILFLPDGGEGLLNHVYIDNLIHGILLAADSDVTGGPFLVTDGVATTTGEFFSYYARMLNLPPPRSLPGPVLSGLLWLSHTLDRVRGRQPRLHPELIHYLRRRMTFSIAKAATLLGYQPAINLQDGMQLTEAWLRETGRLLR